MHRSIIRCLFYGIAALAFLSLTTSRVAATSSEQSKSDQLSRDEQTLLKNKKYRQGIKKMADKLPLQASKLFLECLQSRIPETQKALIRPLLAEALIRSGKTDEGLAIWNSLPDSPQKAYWSAVGLFNKGYFSESLKSLAAVPAQSELDFYALQLKARLAHCLGDIQLLVETLTRLGQSEEPSVSCTALVLLANELMNTGDYKEAETMLDLLDKRLEQQEGKREVASFQPYLELLEAKLAACKREEEHAMTLYKAIANQQFYPEKIRDLARLSLAKMEILHEKNHPDQIEEEGSSSVFPEETPQSVGTGEDRIIAFINSRAESVLLMDAFNILLKEGTFSNNPQAQEKLSGWISNKESSRQPAAMYAMGTILLNKNDWEGALKLAREGLTLYPNSQPIQTLSLDVLSVLLTTNHLTEAESLIAKYPTNSPCLLFQRGVLAFRQGDYNRAKDCFRTAGHYTMGKTGETALFNENLAALYAHDVNTTKTLVEQTKQNTQLQERILFEQAHYAARRKEAHAIDLLNHFLVAAKSEELKIQAELDKAECLLSQPSPSTDSVRAIFSLLKDQKLTPDQRLQMERLNIHLHEKLQEWGEAISACRNAIAQNTGNLYADIFQLKLGELLYKNGDFHEALLVLQPFSLKYPNSPWKDAALFLAGKAAQQSNASNALEASLNIFRNLGKGTSSFSLPAQIEEASILLRLSKADECISLLEALLVKNIPDYIRLLALSIQADAWGTKESPKGSKPLQKSIQLCTDILNTPHLGQAWKFKAFTQRAQFFERANNPQKALDDYASILAEIPNNASALQRRDWYWFYHAGFASIRLMGQLQEWEGALRLAKKMAQTTGPRAREAAAYARKIQLEHFIWQEEQRDEKKAQ